MKSCRNCSTILEVDKVRQSFQIESEMNDLEHTSKCLWFTKVQNQQLTTRQDLPWAQPGRSEYGQFLLENSGSIHANYRMQHLASIPNASATPTRDMQN